MQVKSELSVYLLAICPSDRVYLWPTLTKVMIIDKRSHCKLSLSVLQLLHFLASQIVSNQPK